MSIGEVAEIVTSLGLLFTAIVLCLMSRYLYWIGKDQSDNCDKLAKALAPVVREGIERRAHEFRRSD